MVGSQPAPSPAPTELESRVYTFAVRGTRPVLEFLVSDGKEPETPPKDKLTIEVHSPMSGEIFEARTKNGRIEVDRDGRVVYFSRGPGPVGFTLFLGRALVVTMDDEGARVQIETPSRIVKVQKGTKGREEKGLGVPAGSDTLTIELD